MSIKGIRIAMLSKRTMHLSRTSQPLSENSTRSRSFTIVTLSAEELWSINNSQTAKPKWLSISLLEARRKDVDALEKPVELRDRLM